jgi:N-acetylglucosaminyldiphosphoundecaprenol N-acetyl-beta-D-mannosaminyltransferase
MSSKQIKTVNVLGVPVACIDRPGLFQIALDWAVWLKKCTIYYANAHVLNIAVQDKQLLSVLNQADLVYADGISVVWAIRCLYNYKIEKLTARAWIHEFADQVAKRNLKVFLFGGMERIGYLASQQLMSMHSGFMIAGTEPGITPLDGNWNPLIARINQAEPDILLVGLGSPLQEKWIHQHRQDLHVPIVWAVGALFDYLAGNEKPVPDWFEHLGFEWLWRLGNDPRGKWARYILGNPLFMWRVLLQKIKMIKGKA